MLKAAYLQSEDWSFAAFLHKKLIQELNEEIMPLDNYENNL